MNAGMNALSISRALALLQAFDTRRLALTVAYALIFAIAIRSPSDPDTWWHLRSAEQTIATGIIREDGFSQTRAGERWLNHSWGGQLVMLAAWRLGGAPGLALLTAALATMGMAIVGRMMAETNANAHLRAYTLALGALTATVFWSARPQMFSFVLSAITLLLLRRGGRALWLLPPLFAIWANLHAGFAIGLLWLALAALGAGWDIFTQRALGNRRRWRQWPFLLAACALALCLNPYGPELLLVPIRTLSLSELRAAIVEWQTPDLHLPATWPFLLMLALSWLALGLSRRRPRSDEAILIALTTVMALWAGRNIALFAIVAAPTLAAQLAALPLPPRWRLPVPPRMTRKRGLAHAGLLLALCMGVAAYAPIACHPRASQRYTRRNSRWPWSPTCAKHRPAARSSTPTNGAATCSGNCLNTPASSMGARCSLATNCWPRTAALPVGWIGRSHSPNTTSASPSSRAAAAWTEHCGASPSLGNCSSWMKQRPSIRGGRAECGDHCYRTRACSRCSSYACAPRSSWRGNRRSTMAPN